MSRTTEGFTYVALGLVLGHLIVHFVTEGPEPELIITCEVATTKIWATQQCLKFQPSCPKGGVEMFIEYKQMKDFVAEHCPNSAGDFPPDLSQ